MCIIAERSEHGKALRMHGATMREVLVFTLILMLGEGADVRRTRCSSSEFENVLDKHL